LGYILTNIDWFVVLLWFFFLGGFILLSLLGLVAFPPFAICIFMTEGNLKFCSLGIWDNSYKETYDYYYSSYSYGPEPYNGEESIKPYDVQCS
jgi:hypothetical protein